MEVSTDAKPLKLSVAGAVLRILCLTGSSCMFRLQPESACCTGDWQSLNSFAFQYVLLLMTLFVNVCRLLIERFGYQNTFLITAALKLIAYIPLVPLMAFVDDGICRLPCWRQQTASRQDVEEPLLS